MSDSKTIIFNGKNKPFEEKIFELNQNISQDQILVKITLSTVCGSDVHTWRGHRPFPTPCVLGHEMVGKIVKLGNNIKEDFEGNNLNLGDRITWSMTVGCGNCFFCKNNIPQKCINLFKYGHEHNDSLPFPSGGLSQYVVLKEKTAIFKIPDDLTDEEVSPLMCAGATITSGLDEANFSKCKYVVVQGCGALGLYACAFTKKLGAEKIIAIDMDSKRLSLAKEFGADYVIDVNNEKDIVNKISKITNGFGADYVIEVTGTPSVIEQGIKFLRIGGTYILLGAIYPNSKFTLDSSDIITKCLTVVGMHNYKPESLDLAIKLVQKTKSQYPYEKLVGTRCSLSLHEVEDALKSFESRKTTRPSIKPI